MASFEFEMDTDNLLAVLEGAAQKARDAAAAALYLQAELIMTKAKELTPVALRENYPKLTDAQFQQRYLPGTLRASGQVKPVVQAGDEVSVELGFGNDTADFALIVHEMTTYKHSVGQAKYLEQPINESGQQVMDAIGLAWAGNM